ncbi:MAG: UDP-glucose/GDP-mannose dehydrogenase family protein [Candidatus Lokiarchaeota archaeon]|nr:UDP-glucose/GDP-mannose dehydrogenase family protein [Candidatus Harpocratesius repetitus]
MKISYIGSGYVGQVNAVGAAFYGHDVILMDIDAEKVDSINQGIPTIYEEHLDEQMKDIVLNKKKLRATLDLEEAVKSTEISLISVGTPDKGGMIDLSYIQEVAIGIGKALKNKNEYHTVVVKSTVVPGTTLKLVKPLVEEYSGKKAGVDFGIGMNPEFLREGVAWNDSIKPDSIVIGSQDEKTKQTLRAMYSWAPEEKITYVGINAAEAIKYAKNSFLAMKITFANEWANFCEAVGIDAKEVLEAIGADKRISPMFLRNGPGYGGSCFPKDVNAIVHAGQVNHSPFRILEQVVQTNHNQYLKLIDLAEKVVGPIRRKKVGILGLSFKPSTDDTRESPALRIIAFLVSRGCEIKAYCPQGIPMAKKWLESNRITEIQYQSDGKSCVEDVDLVIVPTDWPEFKEIIAQTTVPTFIGHRSLMDPAKYAHVYALGYPKP